MLLDSPCGLPRGTISFAGNGGGGGVEINARIDAPQLTDFAFRSKRQNSLNAKQRHAVGARCRFTFAKVVLTWQTSKENCDFAERALQQSGPLGHLISYLIILLKACSNSQGRRGSMDICKRARRQSQTVGDYRKAW